MPGQDDPETIGELADRLPANEWVDLPEHGVRVKKWFDGSTCPDGPHRPPQGPNEDVSVCLTCWGPSHEMRPDGETYGDHRPDCSLPRRHESYCQPGGAGHPTAPVVRGYWPESG